MEDLALEGGVDPASALSALVPTAPMDWVTPSFVQRFAWSFDV
jgi:hypothetical protein